MNPKVDHYFLEGCGRCNLYQTPQCKVHRWSYELEQLRSIVLECGLTEEFKWSQPCYTLNGKNVAMISAFNDHAVLAFFKGALLQDTQKLLVAPGKNSHHSRQFRFTDTKQIDAQRDAVKAYIFEAIEIEKAELKVEGLKDKEPMPEELEAAFARDPDFEHAFTSLTPGRQRGYILHFSQPKQSKTRTTRIEKWRDAILRGEGMQDAWKKRK